MGIGLHPNTDSLAVVSMASLIFYLGRGNGRFFVSWGEVVLSWRMGSLVWGGELPLHLPWINPSARQLYAMTIIMCMLSLFCSTNFTITINGQQK